MIIPSSVAFPELLGPREDGSQELWSTAERLHHLAQSEGWTLRESSRGVLRDLLDAAAAAEQTIAEQQARIRHLENLSFTDELTGLLNRRGFNLELERALARAKRRNETGLLVLSDLDHFKAINDSYGHPAGDAVLIAVSHMLRAGTRRSDYVSRIGGDEFAILMTDTCRAKGETLAAKLAQLINGLALPWHGGTIPVSASFGWEPYDHGSQAEQMTFRADRALYRSKRRTSPEAVLLKPAGEAPCAVSTAC